MRRALRLAAALPLAVAIALPATAAGPEAEIDALIGALKQPETSSAEWFGDRLQRLREAES